MNARIENRIKNRISEHAYELGKKYPEIGKYKFEAMEKMLKSLVGQKLWYSIYIEEGDVVVEICDLCEHDNTIAEITVKDNKISVICTAWSYKDCFCGIDEIDRAVRGLNDIIEYSRTNNI